MRRQVTACFPSALTSFLLSTGKPTATHFLCATGRFRKTARQQYLWGPHFSIEHAFGYNAVRCQTVCPDIPLFCLSSLFSICFSLPPVRWFSQLFAVFPAVSIFLIYPNNVCAMCAILILFTAAPDGGNYKTISEKLFACCPLLQSGSAGVKKLVFMQNRALTKARGNVPPALRKSGRDAARPPGHGGTALSPACACARLPG